MSQVLYVCDAFTNQPFCGNPAAVCILDQPVDETWMKLVAREMNLSETAFIHPIENGFSLRWLTPAIEVDLCGHATLASAFTMWETARIPRDQPARFFTRSGWLTCKLDGDWVIMDFPAKVCQPCQPPEGLEEALGCGISYCGINGMDYLVEVADENTVRHLKPNFSGLAKLKVRGIIATSSSQTAGYDFVSRFFAPAAGVDEDPVTGSAHCALGPYWKSKTGKSEMIGYQASLRGGEVGVRMDGDRVELRGQAVLMSCIELFR